MKTVLNNNNRLKVLRAKLHLSQAEFARAYGFSLRTVQEWEQGRHKPDRIARNLLKLIWAHPEMTRKVLSKAEAA
jgi:putative transcriptional regulator